MTNYKVIPSHLQGKIKIPASKSQTLRSLLFASMATGKSIIEDYLPSKDVFSMVQALRTFGIPIEVQEKIITVEGLDGKIFFAENIIDAGNSGIVLRFLTAIGSLCSHPVVITGDYSIRHQRPMKPLLDALTKLNVSAKSMRGDGFAPVVIQGPLQNGKTSVLGEDSQHVSALIIASLFTKGKTEIHVENPGEIPWVELTLHWLRFLNIPYENHDYKKIVIFGDTHYPGFHYTVPADLSSSAFPIGAAVITNSDLQIENIDLKDPQGDKEFIFTLKKMGADLEINEEKKSLQIKKGNFLKGSIIDMNSFIDALPIMAVIACFSEGETQLINAHVARQKECNRISSIVLELKKMGADIQETEDGLLIKKSSLHGTTVFSHHDHRMAMALTVAALGANGQSKIEQAACVQKTFPSFYQDFQMLGANIEEVG